MDTVSLSKDMCRVDSQIFKWRPYFFIQIIVLAACLQKTGGFAHNWPLACPRAIQLLSHLHNWLNLVAVGFFLFTKLTTELAGLNLAQETIYNPFEGVSNQHNYRRCRRRHHLQSFVLMKSLNPLCGKNSVH
jgi:hypothetical protein